MLLARAAAAFAVNIYIWLYGTACSMFHRLFDVPITSMIKARHGLGAPAGRLHPMIDICLRTRSGTRALPPAPASHAEACHGNCRSRPLHNGSLTFLPEQKVWARGGESTMRPPTRVRRRKTVELKVELAARKPGDDLGAGAIRGIHLRPGVSIHRIVI